MSGEKVDNIIIRDCNRFSDGARLDVVINTCVESYKNSGDEYYVMIAHWLSELRALRDVTNHVGFSTRLDFPENCEIEIKVFSQATDVEKVDGVEVPVGKELLSRYNIVTQNRGYLCPVLTTKI